MKKQNSNNIGKVEKMAVLIKTFDYYHHKFQLFQLFCKIAKEFETVGYWVKALWSESEGSRFEPH